VLSTTNDGVEADFLSSIRINPLLNDEGTGRLWAGGVDAVISVSGSARSYSGSAFRLISASVIQGTGTVVLETAQMTRNSANAQGNTGYLVYIPGSNESSSVVIEYTVADANGNQTTGIITISRVDPREIKATGTVIGTSGSYLNNPAWDRGEVFDGNLATYYDALNATGDWAGLDLGTAKQITRIRYAPRSGQEGRMVGGQFQGSSTPDFTSGVVTFHTITTSPSAGVFSDVLVGDSGTYRYVRYIGPVNGFCNVAEVEFYTEAAPAAPVGLIATSLANGSISLDWANNSENDLAGYKVYRSTAAGSFGPAVASNVPASQYTDTGVVVGSTNFYSVAALDNEGYESARSDQVSATSRANQFAPVVSAGPDQQLQLSGNLPWTPSEIAPVGWYDASDATTITASGGAVSQWRDKSVNARDLSQSTLAARPLSGTATINGLNAVDFDGSNDQLLTTGSPFGGTVSNALVMAVHRVDNDASTGTLFTLTGSSTAASRWQAHVPFNGSVFFDTGGSSSVNRVSLDYGTGTGDIVLAGFYGSVTDNVQQIYKNGSLLRGDATGHSVSTVGATHVGSGGSTSYQNSTIGELIIVNGTVAAENRENLEGYLAHKWGLAASLPANHPHKVAAPGGAGTTITLDGSVTDADGGTPPATTWTKVSGPGTVIFGAATAVDTNATILEAGTYVLRLTAFDGLFTTSDEVTVTITEEGAYVDSNNNGIDDAWEIASFGRLLGANETMHESGVPYYFMYLHGTDLSNAVDRFRVTVEPNAGGPGLVFAWEMLPQFQLGVDYDIRISTNLTQWDPLPAEHYTLAQTPVGSRKRFELTLTHDYGSRVFLRLQKP
jgi:hypothetical protein